MSDQLNRRDFIKSVSLTGASLVLTNPLNAGTNLFGNPNPQIVNEYFSISFDTNKGTFNIFRSDGTLFIKNAVVAINSASGKITSASSYDHSADVTKLNDNLGTGKQLIIHSKDLKKKIDLELRFSLYDKLNAVVFEALCKNVSTTDFIIRSLEPVCAVKQNNSGLILSDVSKCLTNGAIYYDAGMIHTFGTPYKKPEPYGETKGGQLANNSLSSINETVRSWWNVGLYSGYNKEGIVLGYLENNFGLGQILISKNESDQFSFIAESVYAPGFSLKSGMKISSNRFMINIADDPYVALENYASTFGKINKARTNSIINGWCNWFYTYDQITEDEVIRNAEFASRNLKQYGFEYIQIDEGFQQWHGEWEGNNRFPHGMKWLAEKINSYGLKPGLWLAPYVVSESTEIFKKHPDWFLKNPDGSLKRVGPWPSEDTDWFRNENPKRYCIDITQPEAEEWFYNLFDTVANKWGYEMIKIDFVAWSVLSADHFYDRSATPAQVYRKGMELIRKAVGDKCHINDCGPGSISSGMIDSMRIELDQNYGYAKDVWKQYFLESSSSAPAAAKRYYFHKRGWINDADHICINLLPQSQAQAAATIIALSGGNIISGDRLYDLDSSRLEILKKVIPSFGEAAKPVDLFDTDLHTVFALKIKKHFAEWTIVGFFNSSTTENKEFHFPLERFWLDKNKTYLAFDFWKEQFLGEIQNEIHLNIQPGSVTLLSLHEKSGVSQFISTDRHVLQGAVEIEDVKWDPSLKILNGISNGPINSAHNIFVFIPESHPWGQGGHALFHDYNSYSLKMIDDHILRIHVEFKGSSSVKWEFNYDDFYSR